MIQDRRHFSLSFLLAMLLHAVVLFSIERTFEKSAVLKSPSSPPVAYVVSVLTQMKSMSAESKKGAVVPQEPQMKSMSAEAESESESESKKGEVVPQEIQPPSGRRSIADQKRSHFLLSTDVLPTALIPTGSSISGDAASALVASSMSDDPFSAFDVSLSLSGMLSTLPSSPQLKAPTPSPVMRLSKGQVKPTSSTLPATLNSTTDRPLFNKNHVAGQESSPDPVLPHAAVDLFRQHSAHVPPESKPESKSEATVSLNTHKVRYASYFSRIKHKIKQGWFYPAQARRNKLYGRVHLIFSIRRDGHLMRVNVVNSSGVQILDRAAMRAVKAAGSFGAFPKAWSLKLLHIRATFEYLRRKTQ